MYNLWKAHLEICDTFKDQTYNSACNKIVFIVSLYCGRFVNNLQKIFAWAELLIRYVSTRQQHSRTRRKHVKFSFFLALRMFF